MSSQVVPLEHAGAAAACLESGNVLLAQAFFDVPRHEVDLFSPSVLAPGKNVKNVSFDPATGTLGGSSSGGAADAARTRDTRARRTPAPGR